jgi:hypothetical protein
VRLVVFPVYERLFHRFVGVKGFSNEFLFHGFKVGSYYFPNG